MWSPLRPTNDTPQPSAEPSTNSMPYRNPVSMPNSRQYNESGTYIGKSLEIKGELSGSEAVHIEGRIEGPISLRDAHLNVGRDAVLTSNVEAGEVIVRGTLHGNVTAIDRVEVHSGGSLTGNVAAGRISIEIGAYCKGNIDMRRQDPKPDVKMSSKTEEKSSRVDEMDHSPALTY